MAENINISEIWGHNISFLFGSGASHGLLPTLKLSIKDDNGQAHTLETLASKFEKDGQDELKTLLFMYYYKSCIEPVSSLLKSQQLLLAFSYSPNLTSNETSFPSFGRVNSYHLNNLPQQS